jgi:anti-anti-sigma regulatory factor
VRRAGAGPVIVDLSQMDLPDSNGVQALIDGYHTAMVTGGTLRVRGARGTPARVLRGVGMAEPLGVPPRDHGTGAVSPGDSEWP